MIMKSIVCENKTIPYLDEIMKGETIVLNGNVVMMPNDAYENFVETLYLLSDPDQYDKIMNPIPCSDGPFNSVEEMMEFLDNEES